MASNGSEKVLTADQPSGGWPWQVEMLDNREWEKKGGKISVRGSCKICGWVKTDGTVPLIRWVNHYGATHPTLSPTDLSVGSEWHVGQSYPR